MREVKVSQQLNYVPYVLSAAVGELQHEDLFGIRVELCKGDASLPSIDDLAGDEALLYILVKLVLSRLDLRRRLRTPGILLL